MNSSPLNYYLWECKPRHEQNVDAFLHNLTLNNPVDRKQNAETVALYDKHIQEINVLEKSVENNKNGRGWAIFGVIVAFIAMCVLAFSLPILEAGSTAIVAGSLILAIIFIVKIVKTFKKKIQKLNDQIFALELKAEEYLVEAYAQVKPLNDAFEDETSLKLFEQTLPIVKFDSAFREDRLKHLEDYGFTSIVPEDESVLETLSGELYDRPFLYDRRIEHWIGTKKYNGSLDISWKEYEKDRDGNTIEVEHKQTLYASVTKPYPLYQRTTKLYYGHEALPDLTFSRTYAHAEDESEQALERKIEKGERRLQKIQEKSLAKGGDFTQVENTEFEVLFNATNRSDELDFREMFTVKAQENIVNLLLYQDGYGDDFNFIKNGQLNVIISEHSQNRPLYPKANHYKSHDITEIEDAFRTKNNEFFRAVYFDFAPLLAIPAYNQPNVDKRVCSIGNRTVFNHEEVVNKLCQLLSPNADTSSILKTTLAERTPEKDVLLVVARAYVAESRTDYVTVCGKDGLHHAVPVEWYEYIPVEKYSTVCIVNADSQAEIPSNAFRIFGGYAYVL